MGLFRQDTKVEALKRTALFEHLPRKHLVALARLTEDLDVPEGKVLCREGETGSEFFVILEGEVEVTRNGERIVPDEPIEFFGEIALIERVPRTATVTAATPLRFFVLTRQSFQRVLDTEPDVERKVLRSLARRMLADSVA
jgi:CRP-like cAMP-binding protein